MVNLRKKTIDIREFILNNVQSHPKDIAVITAKHFGQTKQSINNHIRHLVKEALLVPEGKTSARVYRLSDDVIKHLSISINDGVSEDVIWRKHIKGSLTHLPDNVLGLWNYSILEILNNAIDHSEGSKIEIEIHPEGDGTTTLVIKDNGIGIFKKLCDQLGFDDEKHAALELSKGKLTTASDRHTGQGIFFSSRMVDFFVIESGSAALHHKEGGQFDFVSDSPEKMQGTIIAMTLRDDATRTVTNVFDEYEMPDDGDHGFVKTMIPVKLAQYDRELMVSRSQARRVMARVNRFKYVGLDFQDVESIGQPFADEVFRVFCLDHPEIELYHINANESVTRSIKRAIADAEEIESQS